MDRIRRLLLCAAYYGFARHLPPSYLPGGVLAKAIRYRICRGLFASCGADVNVERGAFFETGRHIRIGNGSGIGRDAEIGGEVTIGDNVMMGPRCVVMTRNHRFDRTDIPMSEQGYGEPKPVFIEDDVWIGYGVTLLPGVRIGRGTVIGAGAVVTKSIPPYSVAAGNPARVIRSRERHDRAM